MKKLSILVLVVFAVIISSCDWLNKKSPTAPKTIQSPIPLAIGNTWYYNAGTDIVLEIESTTTIANKPAYKVAYYFKSLSSIRLYYYWQWDDPYFREFSNDLSPIASYKYPGNVDEQTTWGIYITKLINTKTTTNNFTDCYKYDLYKITSQDTFHCDIKPGIGFAWKSNCGNLISYNLK